MLVHGSEIKLKGNYFIISPTILYILTLQYAFSQWLYSSYALKLILLDFSNSELKLGNIYP